MAPVKITADMIRTMKSRGERIPSLTAYDFPMAKLLDEAGVPLLLVGDSLGMVVLGYPDTTHVTMEEMIHHVKAVARARPAGMVVADLPYQSYRTPAQAVANARRLMDAGAEGVKAEGGIDILPAVQAILGQGMPCLGHIGMLPQHILEEGRYRIKGREDSERQRLLQDADALAQAGVFGIVLELVAAPVAADITRRLSIPTIGIGSGPDCDGQILVTHDLLGLFPWFTPRFVQPKLKTSAHIKEAVGQWMSEVRQPKRSPQ